MAPDLLTAIVTAQQEARVAEDALRDTVERARTAGHTWQEIGECLGTSRQAAFQRFGRPIDPRTGKPMTQIKVPNAAEHAVDLLIDVIEGRWEEVRRDFNDTMLEALDANRISAAWAMIAGSIGAYERMGTPFVRQFGDYTVVHVPLHFEADDRVAQITYEPPLKVAGLFFLPQNKV